MNAIKQSRAIFQLSRNSPGTMFMLERPHFYSWINVSGEFYVSNTRKVYQCRVEVENGSAKLLSLEIDGESIFESAK